MRIVLIVFTLFISISLQSAETRTTLLSSGDVRPVMNQLFEYHIDKKEMTPIILERALKTYIKQFDPTYAYMIEEEMVPYLHPTDLTLRKLFNDYTQDRFTLFFALNEKIQNSITRARSWRAFWFQNPQRLIEDAKKFEVNKTKDEKPAQTLAELQQRHYQKFIAFISFQLKEQNNERIQGQEWKIIALCEKQIAAMENEYLGNSDQNTTLTPREQEHLIILRTLKALAHSLDAHTAYYSPDEAYAMKVQLEKGMCGIGVILREGVEGITIHELIVGGPADKSSQIKKGDLIVEVDGTPVHNYSFHHVLEIMKGKEGSKTVLGIVRYENIHPTFSRVELTRAKITLEDKRVDVEWESFGDGILGKITLYSFYEGEDGVSSEVDLKKAIDHLRSQGPLYGLVLDMRENSGGFLTQAVKVSGLFISSGVVVISKYSDGAIKYYRTLDGTRYYDGPLVVLISRGSASATEIVAQALKDYGVGIIVGDEQTYGKGTIQHQTVTGDGIKSLFKVTVGRYYTVSGKSTQIDGVKADILVPSELNFEELGETYLEYPLPPDWVPSAYHDSLSDIDPFARKWFQKYYIPTLQTKIMHWEGLLPILKANSARRVQQNKNFQIFLREIAQKERSKIHPAFGSNDLQMEEAVNIIKDMIFMSQSTGTGE